MRKMLPGCRAPITGAAVPAVQTASASAAVRAIPAQYAAPAAVPVVFLHLGPRDGVTS